jgi:hypothetical protein
MPNFGRLVKRRYICLLCLTGMMYIKSDSKLLSGFPFIGHGNPASNLESLSVVFTSYEDVPELLFSVRLIKSVISEAVNFVLRFQIQINMPSSFVSQK